MCDTDKTLLRFLDITLASCIFYELLGEAYHTTISRPIYFYNFLERVSIHLLSTTSLFFYEVYTLWQELFLKVLTFEFKDIG